MKTQPYKEIPMFFILGRPRSGTTLLRTLFDSHPNVKIPPEFPIILPLYQRFRHVKVWEKQAILDFVDHLYKIGKFNNRSLDHLNIDRKEYTEFLLSLDGKATIQDILKSVNYFSFSLFPKSTILRIGDKNPIYSIYSGSLIKIFPDAKFICIVRDYRDNYFSMKGLADLMLEAPLLTLQVWRWKYVVKQFLECKKKYPDRFRMIRYEDLVTRQEEVFGELCDFIGIPFDPVVFDFYKKKDDSDKIYPKDVMEKYHKSLMNPINTGRMELWKKELSETEIRMADQLAGKFAGIMGYERRYKKFNLWLYFKSRPLAIYSRIIFKIMESSTRFPYNIAMWLSLNMLTLVRTYHWITAKKKIKNQGK